MEFPSIAFAVTMLCVCAKLCSSKFANSIAGQYITHTESRMMLNGLSERLMPTQVRVRRLQSASHENSCAIPTFTTEEVLRLTGVQDEPEVQ